MPNKINLLRFLIVVLFLSTIAVATETTWRHSGFEISGFDINASSIYNLTEIRKIEFGWNSAVPAVSETSRAVIYYDDNQKRIMQSVNGGGFQSIVGNSTVNSSNRINGGFSVEFLSIAVGDEIVVPFKFYSGILQSVTLYANTAGNTTFRVLNRTADITGGNNLTLSNIQESTDSTLSGWNTTVTTNEIFVIRTASFDTVTNVSVSFVIARD